MVSTNGLNSCTDEQFIELWDKYQSVTKVAKILGITERAVNYRRRSMEETHKLNLPASDSRSAKYDSNRPKSFSPLKQINLGILDGTVIVFSDAHFIPSQRTTAFKGLLWPFKKYSLNAVFCNGFPLEEPSKHAPIITTNPQILVIQKLKPPKGGLGELKEEPKEKSTN